MARSFPFKEPGALLRLLFAVARKETGKLTGKAEVPEPMRVMAHCPGILVGYGMLESAQSKASTVPKKLKTLAAQLAGRLVGCPF